MIWHPKIGQRVQVWYNKKAAPHMPYHAEHGLVTEVSRGPGPHNIKVELARDGRSVIVPRGNLRVQKETT